MECVCLFVHGEEKGLGDISFEGRWNFRSGGVLLLCECDDEGQ